MIDKALSDMKSDGLPCVVITIAVGNDVALKIWQGYGFEIYDGAHDVAGYRNQYMGYVKWLGGKE